MKVVFGAVMAVAVAVTAMAGGNPVTALYPRDITFLLNFDDGTVNPAMGMTEIRKNFAGAAFEEGLFGKACIAGWIRYLQDPSSLLIDTSRPGTFIAWVKLRHEAPQVDPGKRELPLEPGFSIFQLFGKDHRFIDFRKSGDLYWRSGALWLLHGGVDPETGKRFQTFAAKKCSVVGWAVGEWRMVVAAWTADALYVSVNGEPFAKAMCTPLVPMLDPLWIRVNNVYDPKNPKTDGLVALDEIAILSRKLSDTEVKELYDRTRANTED